MYGASLKAGISAQIFIDSLVLTGADKNESEAPVP